MIIAERGDLTLELMGERYSLDYVVRDNHGNEFPLGDAEDANDLQELMEEAVEENDE